jgi:hypothetical protein
MGRRHPETACSRFFLLIALENDWNKSKVLDSFIMALVQPITNYPTECSPWQPCFLGETRNAQPAWLDSKVEPASL